VIELEEFFEAAFTEFFTFLRGFLPGYKLQPALMKLLW
jgi:hypothetical protein